MLVSLGLIACATGEPGNLAPDGGLEIIDAATGDPDADPGCTDMTIDLLANGDFEAGPTTWVEVTNGALGLVREEGAGLPFDAASGSWAAVIGGFNNATIEMTQTITIPAGATPTRLTGSGCWVTEEAVGTMFDFLTIEARDAAGTTVLETLLDISNADAEATCDWTPFEVAITMLAADSSAQIHFATTTDGASVTTFAFDDLALVATVCD